jgi:hypothetical protein
VNTRNLPHLSACEFVAAILRYMPSRVVVEIVKSPMSVETGAAFLVLGTDPDR